MRPSERQRKAYLDALGIDEFVPRGAAGEGEPEASLAADASEQARSAEQVAAQHAVDEPADWGQLREAVTVCTRCPLHESRTQTVFGVGNQSADWLIVGEAPGAEEDRRGEPFVGRAGKLLDEMLRAIGLDRQTAFIANILKCRPPNNRDPAAAEAHACRSYLDRQIALIQPKIILAVGRIASQQLLGRDDAVGKLRGTVHRLGDIPVVVTYHPAYLLRSPGQKAKSWRDLCLAASTIPGRAT